MTTTDLCDDAMRQALLQQLRAIRQAKDELERQEDDLVQRAKAVDIPVAAIAREFGRARQVVHARYSTREVGWRDVDDPQLAAHHALARTHTSGPKQRGQLHLEVELVDTVMNATYDGRTQTWDSDPRTALPDDLVSRLEAAGDRAQSIAERRHAGTVKRQKTIDDGQIQVGRPPLRR